MAKRTRKGKVVHVVVNETINAKDYDLTSENLLEMLKKDADVIINEINVEYEDHAEKKLTQPKGIDMGDGCYMVAGGPIASGVTRNTQRAAKWLRK